MRAAAVVVLAAMAATAHADQDTCWYGVMLGYKAYLESTPDAKFPDSGRIAYMVDYWGDMMVVKHDRDAAHGAAEYIAARMKPTGFRMPPPPVVYEAAREFAVKECVR